jgi:21S rRNA (GM2251-2'-O)-methyltransferase
MSNIVLSRSFQNPRALLVALPLLYPSLYVTRTASLTRAIGRGIRRSQGVGFRGKERAENRDHEPRDPPIRRYAEPIPPGVLDRMKSPLTRDAWKSGSAPKAPVPYMKTRDSKSHALQRSRSGKGSVYSSKQSEPLSIRIGTRVLENGKEVVPDKLTRREPDSSFGRRSSKTRGYTSEREPPRSNKNRGYGDKQDWEHRGRSNGGERRGFNTERESHLSDNTRNRGGKQNWEHRGKSDMAGRTASERVDRSAVPYKSISVSSQSQKQQSNTTDYKFVGAGNSRNSGENGQERSRDYRNRFPSSQTDDDRSSGPLRVTKSIDKRIPLSIPYTTPASEFLYGTSVVEAALRSKKDPRRKLYKLYIYTGENRESNQRDSELERLARRSGVEVSRVGAGWVSLLDKMSGARPHNGYILEASPLPRLPVISLRELSEQEGDCGFKVAVDYQTREDAAVNGSSDFVKASKDLSGRNPLVLFVDSILDPGNLGGIIRTASFLGATAIAISKNCTAFSPVVLKASAGASENITLFTVNKPAGFIAGSKMAGWKIYAAVAPTGSPDSTLTFTDNLADPLSRDPCILMLGSEGEGLRMNLRTKADVQLSIRGSRRSHNVDSLNVSVATGILCNAFLRRSNDAAESVPSGLEKPKVEEGIVSELAMF